jgi:hemolysin III
MVLSSGSWASSVATIGAVLYGVRWPNPWPHTFGYHEFFTP